MEAIITSFRRGRHHAYPNHLIISIGGIETKEKAEKLVGKAVSWQSPGKEKKVINGEIRSSHGNKGALRVIFETGMPGQCLGQKVKIN